MDSTTLDQLDAWRRKRTLSSARGISTIRRSETKWIQIQHRTFAKWVSQQTGVQVDNFKLDFIDGTVFLKLMEVLSGKSVKRYHLFPQSITQRCDNVQLALDICKSQDVRLTNIGAHDIANGSLKLILGLVWCLIQRYHLISIYENHKHTPSKDENLRVQVIRGLNKILDKLKFRVNNIKGDWKDGMALTALVTYLAPAFNRDFMNIERCEYISATEAAMEAAHKYLNIPRLLSSDDFTNDEVDELSMITYLSYFLHPSHRAVREQYLQEHPDYVPLYKPYIEPQQDTAQDKKSPIKKLFSSYKEKLKKVRTTDGNFYKEPYKISERYDGGRVIPPGPLKPTGPISERYDGGRVIPPGPLKPTRPMNPLGSGMQTGPGSVIQSGTESVIQPGTGSVIRHHKTIRRHAKNQCDKTCNKCSPRHAKNQCDKTCETCSPEHKSISIVNEEEEEEEDDGEMSEGEKEEILEKIFNAASVEDLLTIDEKDEEEEGSRGEINRFRRSNTTVQRNRNRNTSKQNSDNLASSRNSELQPFFRDHEILAEYKLLCNNVSSGVYVVPSLQSLQVWNGMIFIKIGMFADGCFKFNLYIPPNFPYGRPTLRFVTPVFHPQIKPSGELNLSKAFPTWTPRKDRIWHLLRYTKRCFFSVNTFDATNISAAEAIHDSIETFRKQARLCVSDSIRLNTVEQEDCDEDDQDMFNVKLLSPTQLQIIKDKLLKGTSDYAVLFQ